MTLLEKTVNFGLMGFRSFLKSPRLLINLFAVVLYFSVIVKVGWPSESSIFSTRDSLNYQAVAEWIFNGTETTVTAIRPLGYPFLIGFSSFLLGPLGI